MFHRNKQQEDIIVIPQERRQKIIEFVNKKNTVLTEELCELTGASVATIRRDINLLASKNKLKKMHGGVQQIKQEPSNTFFDYVKISQNDPFFRTKDNNARIAASLVEPGDVIFLGGGLTCTLMSRYIKEIKNITIATTNVNAIVELANSTDISVMLIGGDIFVGHAHIETLSEFSTGLLPNLFFNKAFFTVDGIDLEYGYSIIKHFQLPLYSYLLNNSNRTYVFLDGGKINNRAFLCVCPPEEINNIICAEKLPKDYIDFYASKNINVYTLSSDDFKTKNA